MASLTPISTSLSEPLLPSEPSSCEHEHEHDERVHQQHQHECVRAEAETENEYTETKKSENINLILTYTLLSSISRSLWNQSVLSAFVYLLTSNDPKYVGYLTAIMGIAQLIFSFPTGIFTDRYRRDTLLSLSAGFGVLAAIVTFTASIQKWPRFEGLGIGLA